MDGVKSIFESKTFWGAVLAVAGSIAGMLGYTFGAAEQQAVVEIVSTMVSTIGSGLAIYGRVVATKAIK